MKFGMNVPIFGEYADARLLAELAVEAEQAGWDGFWIWDHVQWSGEEDGEPRQPTIDPTVALGLIAAATQRVRIGLMVVPLARRRPWKVAREMTTIDHLSDGRLTLGVGLGGPPGLEFGDFGEPTDAKIRAARLDEGLDLLHAFWTGEPVHYEGTHYSVTRAHLLPKPLQDPIPIWVGGEWPDYKAPFRRAARYHGVHPLMFGVPAAEQPARLRELVDYINSQRKSDEPYDVAYGVETAGDSSEQDARLLAEYAAAGVTWWMEPISHWRGSLAEMRARIQAGPPRP